MDEQKVQEQSKKIIGKGRIALRYGVNIFVYTFVSIFMLLVIFFGVSQTTFFKNWLRDTIVKTVNEGINGKISIEQIDGTIFTSLLIKNVTLTSNQKDTVVQAGNIELRTSPLKLLFKDIYIRKFELRDAKIKLIEESDGQLNLLKIFTSSTEPEDTTASEFPFAIEAADFKLTNVDFSMQRFDKVNSNEFYDNLNTDDLRIDNLNLSLSAFADLNKYVYRLTINNISFNPNFNYFQLQHLSGSILLTPQLAGINKLHLITRDSDVELSAAILGVDFLDAFSMKKLENAPVRLSLSSPKLTVDDVTTYVPVMKMFDGIISTELEGSGTFNELSLKKFYINYNNTSLKANGILKNLLDAEKMNFDISITDSYIDPSDPNKLLRDLELPEYMEFGVFKIDTLTYLGGPLDFKTNFAIRTDKGNLNGTANINLRSAEMIYDAKFITKNLDLSPFTSISTDMNSEIKISGVGFDPQKIKFDLSMNSKSSRFGEKYFNSLNINSRAGNGLITTTLTLSSDSTTADIVANLDFKNPADPSYDVKGQMNGVNLAQLLNDKSLDSRVNLTIDGSGQGFNPDSLDLFLVADIKSSRYLDFDIDSTRLIVDVRRNDNGNKIINIISDIADITISGNYKITTLGSILNNEANIINTKISDKFLSVLSKDSLNNSAITVTSISEPTEYENISLQYLLDFKESLNISFGNTDIEIDGQINGYLNLVNNSLALNLNTDLDYLKFWNQKDVYFLINSNLKGDISNSIGSNYDDNIDASISFSCDRLYAGGNFYDLSSKIEFKDEEVLLSFDGKYEKDIQAKLQSKISTFDDKLNFNIQSVDIKYNHFKIKNNENILLSYYEDTIGFDSFKLNVGDAKLNVVGNIGLYDGDHEAIITLDSLSGQKIISDLLGIYSRKKLQADINMKGIIQGNLLDPKFSITSSAKNMKFGGNNLGSLYSEFKYFNNTLNTDIKILDSTQNSDKPLLLVNGFIPIELSSSKDSIVNSKKLVSLKLESDEFDLSLLEDVLPYIQFKKGKLETEIDISGTLSDPIAVGYFSINKALFKVTKNNLDYDFNAKVWVDDEDITIESIKLSNVANTKNGGTITGEGFLKLKELKPDSTFIKFTGNLKVLDNISKSATPLVYGDLVLKTRENIVYSANKEKSFISIPVNITLANLVIPLSKSAYSSSSGFVYRYINHNYLQDKLAVELDSLIKSAERIDSIANYNNRISKLNYALDIKLENEAKVSVVLSKELDQNLVVLLDGNFALESIAGKIKSSGQLNVLDGSKLSFIKTFEAAGNVKFDKISNPIVDITSTYKDYWLKNPDDPSTEQEVAIKIKLKGPLSELNKNFIKDENNIGVYIGRQNIEDDKKEPTKTAADAMFFIITSKFPDDNSSQQDRNLVGQYTTSLAGSLIGSVLNKYFNNYVKGFQLRQTGSQTKFNLIGQAGRIRYEIGGSTEVLQDLSRANVKMEYPVTQRLQLRLERKESENQTSSINNPLFFEGGLKYNFEF